FALVAIIAALPRGLDVQKRNREETIIGQDASVWMSALRSGAQGYNDLTNYWTAYGANYKVTDKGFDYYTPSNSGITSFTPAPTFLLTNGARIIGLLSMPKLMTIPPPGPPIPLPDFATPPFQSNYVVAYVRAMSGPAVDQAPQTNAIVLGDAFTYRMIVENYSYVPVDTNAFCLDCPAAPTNTDLLVGRTNLLYTIGLLATNSHDFRLRFRWPVLPNGQIGNYGAATFRVMAGGPLIETNDKIG